MKNNLLKSVTIITAMLMLISCGKKGESSSSQSDSASASSGSSSVSSSKDASSSKASSSSAAQSTVASTSQSADAEMAGPACFVTILPEGEKNHVLLEIKVPEAWSFDSYTVFSSGEYKTGEVISLTPKTGTEFPTSLTSKYGAPIEGLPEGYGFLSSEDLTIGEAKAKLYNYKTQPSDSDKPWFNYYYLVECGDYILEMGFFSETEADLAVYESIIKSATVHK
ncbi:MAG: hypothetical protein RR978_09770 [Oscillospiraceae bacterium]